MPDVELSSARQPICSWSQASRTFAIHIPPEVIGLLATESLIAFKRVPRRGLEIGGILLGRIDVGEDTTTFWIEGFQPIESEHRLGPSYVLSDADLPRLQAALVNNGTASIGIYRSQTRSEQLAAQQHDIDLFARCFDGDALFLMLAPMPGKAAFFYRSDGELRCVHEFALVSSLSSVAARPGRTSSQVKLLRQASSGTPAVPTNGAEHMEFPEHEPTSGAVVKTKDNLPEETAASSTPAYRFWRTATGHAPGKVLGEWFGRLTAAEKGAWVLAIAVTLLVLTVSALSYSLRRPSAPSSPAPPQYLQLSVDRAGSSLRLHWDPNSAVVRDGAHAILHIQDGGQESDRNLAPSEFRAGSITYEPKSSEVTFRLDLYSGEPHAIGLVQVMFPPSPVAHAPAAEASRAPKLNPAPIAPMPTNKLIASSEAPPAPRIDSNPTPAANVDSKPAASRIHIANYENRQIPSPAVETARESEIAPAPAPAPTTVAVNFDKPPSPSPIAALPEVSVADQKPSVRVSTEPVEGTRFGHLVGKIPVLRRFKKPVKIAAPVPVYQAKPTVKMPETAKLTHPVTIDVKVNVGESGAVDRAEVVEYGDPPNFTLANAALAAARQWTFEMPRVEEGVISSELILHFYFSP